MHKQELRAMEFNADKDHSSFRHFSEQLRVETSAFSSLFIDHSIWSDPILPKLAFTNSTLNRIKNDSDGGFSSKGIGFKNYYSPAPNSKKSSFIVNAKRNNVNSSTINGSHKNRNNVNGKEGENRFKTLPASEALPRNEIVGGYIFVCNNETMQENLERRLFGLPSRYRDSVRAITPGLPLFLYNYSAHQLYGVFEAASFGGTNIDPSAWEDKKKPGQSRFPAQVRVVTRKLCVPLEEDSFRPFLHHYDGPKFRLELCIPEALALLDKFEDV